MSGFHSASDYIKCAYFIVLGSFGILIFIFFTPLWTVSTAYDAYAGLWQGCNEGVCYDRWNIWVEDWIKATQAFVILSLICTSWEVFLTTLFIFHRHFEADKRFIFLCTIFSFSTCFFMFLAVVIWGGSQHLGSGETLSYCFALATILVFLAGGSGVLYLLELIKPIQLGDDQQALLEKTAGIPVHAHASKVEMPIEQGNNPMDLTTDYSMRNLNMSMKSGLNTSVYQSKQPLA